MKLLLIEDSEKLRYHLSDGLKKAGYEVDDAADGQTGAWYAETRDYDAIVLDLMLPGLDGFGVLARLRKQGKQTGVLILTAKDQVSDRVKGLRSGADDYLTKPFSFDELIARVEALTRRCYRTRDSQIVLRGLVIDTAAKSVSRGGSPIELSAREYSLLEYLALRRNRVHSRDQIESWICDANSEVMSNVVDAAIYALRRKIDVDGEPSIIQTRRGMGYAIVSGDESCPSADE